MLKKPEFADLVKKYNPDVLCLQEVKAKPEQVRELPHPLGGYFMEWMPAERLGYSGVSTVSKQVSGMVIRGLDRGEFDGEGRVLETKFGEVAVINCYFPNGGQGPHRVEFKLRFYAELLDRLKPRIRAGEKIAVVGDYNTAHTEIDLARPKENEKTSGFLPEERVWVQKFLDAGFTDAFRHFHPGEKERYSWWDMKTRARDRNIGWRIDYVMVSPALLPFMKDCDILDNVRGSDHAPVIATFDAKVLK